MSGNTESTANSAKFAPMPMSALLANLMPLQTSVDISDASCSSGDDSDNSCVETVAKKLSPCRLNNGFRTPNTRHTSDIIKYASERKNTITNHDHDKENLKDDLSNHTYPYKDNNIFHSVQKGIVTTTSEVKSRPVLMPHNNNRLVSGKVNSVVKRTPEIAKAPSSSQKAKIATPKIKSGIRRFTPNSTRQSHKKAVIQNREKVKCELFTQKQSKDDVHSGNHQQELAPGPVPETPVNRKQMPVSSAATPSYPQGAVGNNSKILFKTTNIKDKKYLFIKKLGTGGSSEVYKVLEVRTSCEYAVKCVFLATDQELAQGYVNEVRLLRELQNSDRVIRLYDYEYDRSNQLLRMVLEVGEDRSVLVPPCSWSWPATCSRVALLEEMLLAVNYIHERGVIHADLKPANFLLVCGRLKLIDFGIASAISSDATSVVRAQATGTYSYISPEALMGGAGGYGGAAPDGGAPIKISFHSDVWSLGCILYSMVYGRTPFGHIPSLAKLAAILDPNHKIDYPPVEHLPAPLLAALQWCLTYNARARPQVRELLGLRYLAPPAPAPAPADTAHPLPPALLQKLQHLVEPAEFRLLQRAQIPTNIQAP
ncbi:hypothetical protein ACJJTC_002913 [Scirpophaga incertulas]